MEGQTDMELLQRYRRDRRELLNFLLSASLVKKVVMPPGAVSLDDVDLDQVSVDYVLECARKTGVLELSEAIKAYYDDLNLPPNTGSGLAKAYLLVTNPELSGPPPPRTPPPIANSMPVSSPASLSKTYSLHSAPSQQLSVDDEIDDFEDEEEDNESTEYTSRRRLNDVSDLVLELPSLKTGLLDDDLRETAYEVLLASVGASGGLVLPTKEKKKEKKSKLMKKLTRSKSEKSQLQPQCAPGLAGLLDIMRIQMEISEASDRRTREGLLHAAAGRVGKRMDTLLVPLELLCFLSQSDFSDKKSYLRWQKRQLNILEEGLLNHPAVRLDTSERIATELRVLLMKIEEAEGLPSPAGVTQRTESLKAMREVALVLAERPARGDITGEVCHWADGYHLNVRLYEKLLYSVFDTLDEGRLVEEVEEIMELLKSTWRVLGITQTIHDTCYTWVLFRQFVLTGESDLLRHATQQMKRIALDGQRSAQERQYMKSLRCSVENGDGHKELSFVQAILIPIKKWTDKRLRDYHTHFHEGSSIMEGIVTAAMVSGRLIAEESDQTGVARMTSTSEMAAVSKQTEDYILSSVKAAYERVLGGIDSKVEAEHDHRLAVLAEDVKRVAKMDSTIFSSVLSPWNPMSTAISASLLHQLYGKELKPFLDGASHLTEDVASVLTAADSLDQYLLKLVSSVCQDGQVYDNYKQQMLPYQVETISGTLIMRWINMQLGRISEWIERTIQQEKWELSSSQHRHGSSIVEVYRIMEETVDQFFSLQLPMRVPQLNGLVSGLDNALQAYTQRVVSQLVDKQDLIPPVPILTRYKKESGMKAFSKKKVVDPRLPDDRRSSQINVLSTSKLCVRLNSLHYAVVHLNVLEDSIRERWAQKRPQENVMAGRRWRFQPSDTSRDKHADVAGMFQASHPDMEIVVGALERELNSRPEEGVIIGNSSEKIAGSSTSEVASSSMFSCDLGSPSQATVEAKAIASVEVSDSMAGQSEAPGTRTPPAEALSRSCNNQKSVPAMNNFIGKRRSRSGNRAPLTIMRADPAEFQAMVQQMTGLPLENSSRAAPSIFKPQPKRPGQIGSNIMPSASSWAGLPIAINGLFGSRPNYLHPTAFFNNLAENPVYSVGTSTSTSHINSIGIDKANTLQSQFNAFAQRGFWN